MSIDKLNISLIHKQIKTYHMTTNYMTTNEIFKANQVLTLEIAKTLIGKEIACTNPEYKANTPQVELFKVCAISTKWEEAAKNVDPANFPQGNQQLYWASYMKPWQIVDLKNTFVLIDENGSAHYNCEMNNAYFKEPTFFWE